jgi:hypothetical protein
LTLPDSRKGQTEGAAVWPQVRQALKCMEMEK